MNQKLIVANLMLAVLASACGDSTYAPNGINPYGQGTLNGLPNQQFMNQPFMNQPMMNQPFMNQPFANYPVMNQPFNWQNQQQQMILQNQLMWQAQIQAQNTGCFPQTRITGCFPQPRPSCTTYNNNYYAPNRQYILSTDNRLYSTGQYILVSRGRGRNKCYTTVPVYTYRSNKSVNINCLTCNDSNNSTTASTTTTTTTTHGSSTGTTAVNTTTTTTANPSASNQDRTVVETVSIVWTGDEAKELYKRLNVVEKDIGNRVVQKKGANLHCEQDKRLLGKNEYACSITINKTDALVLRQSEPGKELKSDENGFFKPEEWTSGENVMIGGDNRGADEAILKFEGKIAQDLFSNMKGTEVSEKHEITKNDIVSKTSGQLKCYQTINTTNNKFYCEVKLQAANGAIQDDYTAAAPSSAAEATADTGKDQTQTETSETVVTKSEAEAPKTEAEAPKTEAETPKTETETTETGSGN